MSRSPISVFEHMVGMPTPRLTIQPSWNSNAIRSAICWRVSPLLVPLIGDAPGGGLATILQVAAAPSPLDVQRCRMHVPDPDQLLPQAECLRPLRQSSLVPLSPSREQNCAASGGTADCRMYRRASHE